MKTSTTFRSDDEYWAWVERRARLYERLWRAARYAALLAAGALVLFTILYFAVRSVGAGHYDAWSEALNSCRSPGG
jgi:hypothetical protein